MSKEHPIGKADNAMTAVRNKYPYYCKLYHEYPQGFELTVVHFFRTLPLSSGIEHAKAIDIDEITDLAEKATEIEVKGTFKRTHLSVVEDIRNYLTALIKRNFFFEGRPDYMDSNIISGAEFSNLIRSITEEREQIRDKNARNPTAIVKTARMLKLHPSPSESQEGFWQCDCPGTNHFIIIGTSTQTWGCGYCKVKGDADDLKKFVEQRQQRKKAGTRITLKTNNQGIF